MYVLASLAQGVSVIRQPLRSDDTDGLLGAIETAGVIVRPEHDVIRINGSVGRYPGGGEVNLGAGGTPARFMIAAATCAGLPMKVDGNHRMRERPVAQGVDVLRALGATIAYVEEEGRLPVLVTPGEGLPGGRLAVGSTASSQFISAAMLIAPFTRKGVEIVFDDEPTSSSYLELTAGCLCRIGVNLELDRSEGRIHRIQIPRQDVAGFDLAIEADASSAIYPAALAAMLPDSQIEIHGLPAESSQPDLAALKALRQIGATVNTYQDKVLVKSGDLKGGFDLDCSLFPDAAVMLAVLASRCSGTSQLRGLATLRVKETDRIAAVAQELRRFGCTVAEGPDEMMITPGIDAGDEVVVRTYEDHRMAMAFAILGAVRGNVGIENPDCANKSHPGFYQELALLTGCEQSGDTA